LLCVEREAAVMNTRETTRRSLVSAERRAQRQGACRQTKQQTSLL
jgi:hypothetical protein